MPLAAHLAKSARGHGDSSYDPVAMQLQLSLVAIHTTADLLTQFIVDVSYHPEILTDLKEEIFAALQSDGWTKAALFKMRLLDSALKETQRMTPIMPSSMVRGTFEDYTLPDGTFIPKGHALAVSTHLMRDPAVYKDPETWDGYRFYRQRQQSGKELSAQLVTTSPEHLGFGHGAHACPGRFFAANEVKIALTFIILQYEWRLLPGAKPKSITWGNSHDADPTTQVEVRKTANIKIDSKAGVIFT